MASHRCFLSLVLLSFLLVACATHFPIAKVEALKSDTLTLMAKGAAPYSNHSSEVDALIARLKEARSHEAAIKHNEAAVGMWDKMIDPQGSLLGGFVSGWQKRGKVSSAFIPEKTAEVQAAFDKILGATRPPQK